MSDKKSDYTPKDWIKDAVFFVLTVAGSYGYFLLLLLIFSFMTAYYIKMDFEMMLILSGIGACFVAIWYIIKTVRKYRR